MLNSKRLACIFVNRPTGLVLGLLGACALLSAGATAHMDGAHGAPPTCGELKLACAATASPYVAPDGSLWIVARAGNRLLVTHSSDDAKTFSPPIALGVGNVTLDWGPDAAPKIVVDESGTIVVAYAIFRNDKFDGEVFTTRSIDRGRTFSKPQPITDIEESQRFPALAFDANGMLYAAWLDKRGGIAAKAKGARYDGAALAIAASSDTAARFGATRIVREGTCECCRIALAIAAPGRPVVLFRNIFPGGIRDHAVITFDRAGIPGPSHRVAVDDWAVDACPHQGPSLAVAADGSYHAVWFTLGRARRGLFYARSLDGGVHFTAPMQLGKPGEVLSRPFVLATGTTVHLAWKAFDGESTRVVVAASRDGGATWTAPRVVATSDQASDHPILVAKGMRSFLSWQTREGYRFIALGDDS